MHTVQYYSIYSDRFRNVLQNVQSKICCTLNLSVYFKHALYMICSSVYCFLFWNIATVCIYDSSLLIVLYWFASTDDLVLTISCFWNKLALTELTSESFSSVTPNVILQINFAWEISFTICALVRVHSSMNIHVSPESRGSVKLFSTQIALSGSSWSWPPLWCRHHHHLEVRNVIS